jgi:RNA:NAD 2'-phosphotransferase (TPT1/KptA family)
MKNRKELEKISKFMSLILRVRINDDKSSYNLFKQF